MNNRGLSCSYAHQTCTGSVPASTAAMIDQRFRWGCRTRIANLQIVIPVETPQKRGEAVRAPASRSDAPEQRPANSCGLGRGAVPDSSGAKSFRNHLETRKVRRPIRRPASTIYPCTLSPEETPTPGGSVGLQGSTESLTRLRCYHVGTTPSHWLIQASHSDMCWSSGKISAPTITTIASPSAQL
jgi:hypothetical protein